MQRWKLILADGHADVGRLDSKAPTLNGRDCHAQDANAAFSHHVAVASWVQGGHGSAQREWLRQTLCEGGDRRGATMQIVVPWNYDLLAPVTFCGAGQWAHQAVGARRGPFHSLRMFHRHRAHSVTMQQTGWGETGKLVWGFQGWRCLAVFGRRAFRNVALATLGCPRERCSRWVLTAKAGPGGSAACARAQRFAVRAVDPVEPGQAPPRQPPLAGWR
jgi:hypothetical protein